MRFTRFVAPRRRCPALVRAALCAALLFGLNGCYVTEQGLRFLSLNTKAEDMEVVLRRDDLPVDVRRTLTLVREIKNYSVARLGLDDNRSYTRYVDLLDEKTYLVDVVSACEATRFEPYLWSYPFLGKMPYKGFFERTDAEREARRLKKKGYDVVIWKVDAFSTLGFFADPVFSFMKDYSVYELASVIIHEQTHATLFLRNQARFNEELATFVGDEGAIGFIRERYSAEPEKVEEAYAYRRNLERHLTAMRELYDRLDALYSRGGDREAILERKGEILERFKEEYRDRHGRFFEAGGTELNNAYLTTVITYTGDLSLFRELNARFDADLARTIRFLKGLGKRYFGPEERRDPKEAIREYLAGSE